MGRKVVFSCWRPWSLDIFYNNSNIDCVFYIFYTTIQFNTVEYSKNLQQNGGFIPGIRPGRSTSDYLTRTVNRLVFPGGLALSLLAVIPYFLTKASGMSFNFGGTSMIIVVGVVLETARTIEQLMLMRHYKGFLK